MTNERKTGHVITAVVAIAFAAAVIVWFIDLSGGLRVGSDYEVRVVVPNAASVTTGARVTMAGAPVGKVASVQRKGSGAVLELALTDERVYPLAADATARVRAVTAVGENYVEINAGRARATIADGGTLTAATTGAYVDADEILSVLQGKTRQRLRDVLQGLGGALDDRGDDLHRTLAGTTGTLIPLAQTVQTLAADRDRIARLSRQFGEVAAAAGERGDTIRVLARNSVTTFRTTARRDAQLRALIDALPSTLRQVRRTTDVLDSVSRAGTPVVADVASAVAAARPVVSDLRPAAQAGREAIHELDAAAPRLGRLLRTVTKASRPAADAVTALRGVTCETTPLLRYLEPYRADLTSFVGAFGSAVNAYDALGHLVRLSPVLGENSLAGLPDEASKAALKLVHEGLLSRSTSLNWDPYPKPGMVGKATALGSPQYTGPEDFAKRSNWKYPRIEADC